jgi:hypothetical protein
MFEEVQICEEFSACRAPRLRFLGQPRGVIGYPPTLIRLFQGQCKETRI